MHRKPQQHEPYQAPQVPEWVHYERLKARWLNEHPNAAPDEYTAAMRQIIKELGL